MLQIIKDNPYRILGVKADASKLEISANANKIKAFAKINRTVSFPIDSVEIIGDVARTEQSIDSALSLIQNETDKIKYALFWFYGKSDNVSTLQSQVVHCLITGDFSKAIYSAASLYENYSQEILGSLSYENSIFTSSDLRKFFIEGLLNEIDFSKVSLDESIIPSDWYIALKGQSEVNLLDQLKDVISEIKNSPSPEKKYGIALSFVNTNGKKVEDSAKSVNPNSPLYPIIDNFADELISCAVDYQRNSMDYYADKKAYVLAEFASKCAQVSKTKTRCKENLDIFRENQSSLLPESFSSEAQQIRKLRIEYTKSNKSIELGRKLAESARPILSTIKARSGLSKAYLSCCEDVVNDVLTVIIDRVNEAMHGTKEELYKELKDAYDATKLIGEFDMGSEFKSKRFDPNANTLKVMCLRRGIVKRTFEEMLKAEDSSSWQAALLIHIIAVIAGAIITDNGDAGNGALIGLIAGGLIWLCCWRDRSEDELGDGVWGCIGSFGCLSLVLMGGIFVYWVALKGVKYVINKIKGF